MKKQVKKVVKKAPVKENKLLVSNQEKCRLFKIPAPIFMELVLYSVSDGKELLEISRTCKKMMQIVYMDPRPWLSLVLLKFPKAITPASELIYRNSFE